jgi:hypothetical protein
MTINKHKVFEPKTSSDETKLLRYGLPWSSSEFETLELLWGTKGYALDAISTKMQRPIAGILAKLRDLGFVVRDTVDCCHYCFYDTSTNCCVKNLSLAAPKTTQPTQETTIMANIEIKTFIDNQDASRLSDDEIFSKIAALELQINQLSAISRKPKKLDEKIQKLQQDIEALVEYVDNRK